MWERDCIKHGFIKIKNLVLDLGQLYLNIMDSAQSSGFEQEKKKKDT